MMKIIKPQVKKKKNSAKGKSQSAVGFFKGKGVERVRKKQEIRKCSLSLVKLRMGDIK